ncbi:MAG: hypothetical protein J6M64_12095 [Oscillospiraceae bacterium]|nr:hypothetical protein [Oscillospiraceae bacterium]
MTMIYNTYDLDIKYSNGIIIMTTTIKTTLTLTLTWSGKAVFQSLLFSASDVPDLFSSPQPRTDPLSVSPVTVDQAKHKYKKQIEDDICSGFFTGTISVGCDEIDWEWDPVFEIEGSDVDKNGIEDYLEDVAGAMLGGAESGSLQIPVEVEISVDITAQAGALAMGEVTVDSMDILDVYESCSFATDGKNVIFDEEIEMPETAMKAVKAEISRTVRRRMEVKRDQYTFIGASAEKSAHFYDVCMKMHEGVKENDPELYRKIAWESAHKFGSRAVTNGYASTSMGACKGERALEAAEFIDRREMEIYSSLPEFGRRKAMAEAMSNVVAEAEKTYGVKFSRF